MSNPMRLDLVVRQVQDDVGLTCILDSIRLDLVVSQVQGDVSLTRIANSICLDLAISKLNENKRTIFYFIF